MIASSEKRHLAAHLLPRHRHLVSYLTDDQSAAALRFIAEPSSVPLPPMALDVLTALLIDRWGTEEYEREIGAPVRSARALAAQALDTYMAIESTDLVRGSERPSKSAVAKSRDDEVEILRAKIEWLVGDGAEAADLISAYGLTRQQAAILLALQRANGRAVSYDSLLARLNVLRPDADMSSVASLQAQVSYMRRKLRAAGVPHEIEYVYGVGYRMVPGNGDSQS